MFQLVRPEVECNSAAFPACLPKMQSLRSHSLGASESGFRWERTNWTEQISPSGMRLFLRLKLIQREQEVHTENQQGGPENRSGDSTTDIRT